MNLNPNDFKSWSEYHDAVQSQQAGVDPTQNPAQPVLKSLSKEEYLKGLAEKAGADVDAVYSQILERLGGIGQAGRNDIARQGREQRGVIAQDFIGRGLSGTTAFDNANQAQRSGENRATSQFEASLADRIAAVTERRATLDYQTYQTLFEALGQEQPKKKKGLGGLFGSIIGGIAAPFTGGASLALGPIGSAFDQ